MAAVGQQFGMAGPWSVGQMPAFFADGSGDDGVENAGPGGVNGVDTELQRGLSADEGRLMQPRGNGVFIIVGNDDLSREVASDFFVRPAQSIGFHLGQVGGVFKLFVEAEDNIFCLTAQQRIGQGFDDDFGADAAGVAHGDADNRLKV
jgi:hypothetical protein